MPALQRLKAQASSIHDRIVRRLPLRHRVRYMYWRMLGKWPDLRNPRSFNEKLTWRKLHLRDPRLAATADKIKVRSYVEDRIGSHYLAELYGTFANASEIDFHSLPNSFVIKANHGSGWNRLIPDARTVELHKVVAECDGWLAQRYDGGFGELWYQEIEPRLLVEEYLTDESRHAPIDYKFFVFDGDVAMIQVDLDRFSSHCRNLYRADWVRVPCELKYPAGRDVSRPQLLDEMLNVATRLGAGFDFVRVDLYGIGSRVVFGELTHCPGSGWEQFSDPAIDAWLGSMMRLPHEAPEQTAENRSQRVSSTYMNGALPPKSVG